MGQAPCSKRNDIDFVGIIGIVQAILVICHHPLHVFQLLGQDIIAVGILKCEIIGRRLERCDINILVPPVRIALKDVTRRFIHIDAAVRIALDRFTQQVHPAVLIVQNHIDKTVARGPRHVQQFTDNISSGDKQVVILDEQPVLVLEFALIAAHEQIFLLLQLDFVGFLVGIGARVATDPDGHAAHVFLIVSAIINHTIYSVDVLVHHEAPRHLGSITYGAAHTAWRSRYIFTGRLFLIHRLDI